MSPCAVAAAKITIIYLPPPTGPGPAAGTAPISAWGWLRATNKNWGMRAEVCWRRPHPYCQCSVLVSRWRQVCVCVCGGGW
jgi:hypothetical protein